MEARREVYVTLEVTLEDDLEDDLGVRLGSLLQERQVSLGSFELLAPLSIGVDFGLGPL